MVAPVFESSTLRESSGNESNFIVDMPATRPDGDFYFLVCARDNQDYTVTEPATYTELADADLVGGSARGWAAYAIGASEPASYLVICVGGSAQAWASSCLRYSGVDPTTQIGAISSIDNDNSGQATAAAITATADDSLILRLYWIDTDGLDGVYSGGTERVRSTDTGNGRANIAVVEEASPGNGNTTGTHTADLTANDDWNAMTVEIMPVAVAGSGFTSIAWEGGIAGHGGIAGPHGGIAG